MPLTLESTDYIPSVDAALDQDQLSSIRSLVQAYLPVDYRTRLHSAVDSSYEPAFPQSVLAEGERISAERARDPGSGIDLSRYEAEALDGPAASDSNNDGDAGTPQREQWRAALTAAYSTSSHLGGRAANLALLETYGKNAWLVGNAQLEDVLRALERDIEGSRMGLELLDDERRARGTVAKTQLDGLEHEWKKAVGGGVDVKVAVEELRMGVLEAKRTGGKV